MRSSQLMSLLGSGYQPERVSAYYRQIESILESGTDEELNGEYDADGNYLSDTSTMIVSGRKQTYSKAQRLISGLAKRNKLNEANIRKWIEAITNASEKDEYAGVVLYVLRRKLREKQLKSM